MSSILLPGTRLGRYEIRSKIGEGGMGVVYRVFDPKINREVAIKVLPTTFSADRDRIWKEITPADPAGISDPLNILMTPDGNGYVYQIQRHLADLYLAQGLK